jgi:hypothetical protein
VIHWQRLKGHKVGKLGWVRSVQRGAKTRQTIQEMPQKMAQIACCRLPMGQLRPPSEVIHWYQLHQMIRSLDRF